MPNLRIVSWNSTGENALKAGQLAAIQPALAGMYPLFPNVDVYLIQEAQNGAGGAIDLWLNALVGYTVTHIAEQPNGGGAGYICATRNATVGAPVIPLQLWDYTVDPDFGAVAWPPIFNMGAVAGAAGRPPAYTLLNVGGDDVLLITWHAPLGPSLLPIIVGAMPGGGLIDAYLALDNSQLLQHPGAAAGLPADPDLVIIAGDLNVTAAGLAATYPPGGGGGGYIPLNNFFPGFSNNLDHILTWDPAGALMMLNVLQGHNTPSASVHDIISARTTW